MSRGGDGCPGHDGSRHRLLYGPARAPDLVRHRLAVSWLKLGTPGRDEASAQVARRPARDLNVEAVGSPRL